MTSKRPQRTDRKLRNARQSIAQAREAVQQVDEGDVDPASGLFFQFAAPLLMTARNDHEFTVATTLAEFVWAATHFDAAAQALMLDEFIRDSGVPDEMIPWLLDIYGELAARKMALVG